MQSEQTVCGKRRGLAALWEEIKEKKETTHSSEKPEDAWFCIGGARWERTGSIQRQVSGQLVGALGGERLQRKAGEGRLAVELRHACVADQRGEYAALFRLTVERQKLFFGIHIDADLRPRRA